MAVQGLLLSFLLMFAMMPTRVHAQDIIMNDDQPEKVEEIPLDGGREIDPALKAADAEWLGEAGGAEADREPAEALESSAFDFVPKNYEAPKIKTKEAPTPAKKPKAPAPVFANGASEADFATPLPPPPAPPMPVVTMVEMLDADEIAPPRGPWAPPVWSWVEILRPTESVLGEATPQEPVVAPMALLPKALPNKIGEAAKTPVKKKKLAVKKTALKKKKKPRFVVPDFDEEEYDRQPADAEGNRVFTDAIRALIDFNGEYEVSFKNQNRRYRLHGSPDEIAEYQSTGQFVEVRVHEPTRRILSITPKKVRFRPIR